MSCRLLLDRLVWKRSGRHPLTQWEYRYLLLPARKMLKNRGLRPSSIQGRPGGPRRRDEGGSTTCHAVAERRRINHQLSGSYPQFRFPRRNYASRRQLLLLKLLGSPALSDERAAPVKVVNTPTSWAKPEPLCVERAAQLPAERISNIRATRLQLRCACRALGQ